MRAVVLWLHDNTCYLNRMQTNELETHHCDHDSANNELLNFVPLSKPAHTLVSISKAVIVVKPQQIIDLLQAKIDLYKKML